MMNLKFAKWFGRFVFAALLIDRGGSAGYAQPAVPAPIHSISIVLDREASPPEQRVAELLKSRILSYTSVAIEVGSERKPGADLYIHLGKVRASGALNDLCTRETVRPPGKETPNPEGFALKTVQDGKERVVLALGADDRGALY